MPSQPSGPLFVGEDVKKKRNHPVRLMRLQRTYTMREIARKLSVNIRTAQNWHKLGMEPIASGERPLLFLGSEVRLFLLNRRESRKCKLGPSEFYCPRCRVAVESIPESVQVEFTGRRMGVDDEQVLIKGVCAQCDCRLTRFCTRKRFKGSIWERKLSGANRRLSGMGCPRVNVGLER